MPVETFLATPVSTRSYSEYCRHQPLRYHDLSKPNICRFHYFFSFHFSETSRVRFLSLFLQVWKQCISFFYWKLPFSHSITATGKGHNKQHWDELHNKRGGSHSSIYLLVRPSLELNPTHHAKPGLCCLQEKASLPSSFAATVASAAANITCINGAFLILQNPVKTFISEFYRFALPYLFMVLFICFKPIAL